jgi:hypothetical protein
MLKSPIAGEMKILIIVDVHRQDAFSGRASPMTELGDTLHVGSLYNLYLSTPLHSIHLNFFCTNYN